MQDSTPISFVPGSQIHLIGIAGSGMNGIAQILNERGYQVSGSDAKDSATLTALASKGITTYIGHRADQIGNARYVIISSAITETNPELIAARDLGLEVVRRASALARLLPGTFSLAVAGTHGKTTTSGMFAHLFDRLGRDPSFVIGSTIASLGTAARQGSGAEFVVEADESDGSFLDYRPDAAIITNVELDHVDNFSSLEDVMLLFTRFIATVKSFVVICADDANATALPLPKQLQRITYGYAAEADLRLIASGDDQSPGGPGVELQWRGSRIGTLHLQVPGRHNLLNASAVVATSLQMGFRSSAVLEGLADFAGTARRFEVKGAVAGITVVDDYGHHPTEIQATIAAARSVLESEAGSTGRLCLIFQPHRFTRTAAFLEQFASALDLADRCLLLEIYSAGESEIPGMSSAAIASKMSGATLCRDGQHAIDEILVWAQPGDLLITLGAGDVTELGPQILKTLKARR